MSHTGGPYRPGIFHGDRRMDAVPAASAGSGDGASPHRVGADADGATRTARDFLRVLGERPLQINGMRSTASPESLQSWADFAAAVTWWVSREPRIRSSRSVVQTRSRTFAYLRLGRGAALGDHPQLRASPDAGLSTLVPDAAGQAVAGAPIDCKTRRTARLWMRPVVLVSQHVGWAVLPGTVEGFNSPMGLRRRSMDCSAGKS